MWCAGHKAGDGDRHAFLAGIEVANLQRGPGHVTRPDRGLFDLLLAARWRLLELDERAPVCGCVVVISPNVTLNPSFAVKHDLDFN